MEQACELPATEKRSRHEGAADFTLTEKDFRYIADLIGSHAGIVLNEIKRDLVYGRLVKRLRALKLTSFAEYCRLLEADDGSEFEQFVNSLTTNLTGFFRENHHFEYLSQTLLPKLMQERGRSKLRIWSAGCSTGAEPYSIAMTVADTVPGDWDVKILATDIDTAVLETARQGIYEFDWVAKTSNEQVLKRWAMRGVGERAKSLKVRPELQQMITFNRLNLLESWPMRQPFDIIFCRNVVIYFDKPTQSVLFDRMANQLIPGGHLIIGHSESLNKVCDRFSLVGKTIYRKER